MEKRSISINNKIIHYKIAGEGNTIVLLHGFGEDSAVWQSQAAHLLHHYQVITPDIPGSGDSDLTSDVSMEAIAAVIKDIADTEELDSFVLIGHSMGGYATLAFAERYPEMLKGFGLFHSSALPDTEEKKNTRRKGIQFIKQHGTRAFLDTVIPNLFSEDTQKNNPALIKKFSNSFPEFSKPALIEYYEAMIARPDRTQVLKDSRVPVLFIIGQADNVIPAEQALHQASFPAVSHITILEKSGHMGMLEETNKSNQALEDFLAAIY